MTYQPSKRRAIPAAFVAVLFLLLVLASPAAASQAAPASAPASEPGSSGSSLLGLRSAPAGPHSADVTISVPATPTILSPADGAKTKWYQTTLTVAISADTTLVSVLAGGSEVASRTTSGETSVVIGGIPLRLGPNVLEARSENASGTATSTPITIKVIGPVSSPVFYNVFYRKVFYQSRPNITGKTRGSTTGIELYLNGRLIRRMSILSWRAFSFRSVPLRYGMNRIGVVAYNEFYRKGTGTYKVWRLDVRPNFRTLVLVDKSERHLYFIKNYKLIAYYPCAIGKPSTPTPERVWRIDSKEYPHPSSVYGPRKMRLFMRMWTPRGYTYRYTNYAIHGTNNPRSIGTMASHGCIRMYNWQILKLFPLVPLHTYVVTRR
ncbi:MAG: murein L,D-transpeptidase [Actinobacteria bacterium]|nr:MAG: murein L,D-transpeptidase [Actinomycetota bacterium]